MRLSGASLTVEPPLSKSLLPRTLLTVTSSGRRWWTSVPGPVAVPKSPWDLAQTCSRFQSSASPPLVVFDWERPEYSRITLFAFAGSWSVTLSAFQTWSYDSLVLALMIECNSDFSAAPVRPIAVR